ncbi:MAG TPA: SDR family oxidoreductase [Polyangiaceae bacterium]
MHITVFGANGKTGKHVVEQALAAGHHVRAVVRDPKSIETSHERLEVVRGDVMDASTLDVAGDAVVSCIGARTRKAGKIAERGTENVLVAMKRAGVKRLVVISAAPLGEPKGAFERIAFRLLWAFLRDVYDDLRRMESVLVASDSDWTITRPPRLTNGAMTGSYKTAIDANAGSVISRADLAREMLRCLEEPKTIRHTVGLGR